MSSPLFDALYNAAIRSYGLGIRLASSFSSKADRWLAGRKHQQWEQLQLDRPVWVHCSSLGEFEQGRPLIEWIRRAYPEVPILLTFFSPSGYEIRKDYDQVDAVRYIDLDLRGHADHFIHDVQPRLAIFVKYDFWYHHLSALGRSGIPYIFIAAIFRRGHFLFRSPLRPLLDRIRQAEHIFLQDTASAALLSEAGFERLTVVGDPRVDRVLARSEGQVPRSSDFKTVVVFGSIWLEDLEMVKSWIVALKADADAQIIIAPHEVDDKNLRIFENVTGISARFSRIDGGVLPKHLLVDTIGDLAGLYAMGTIAYIGGGFGHGIHNILEPAAAGIPILFGPKYEKFPEAVALTKRACAFPINTAQEVLDVAVRLSDEGVLDQIKEDTLLFLETNKGATRKIFKWLEEKQFLSDDVE